MSNVQYIGLDGHTETMAVAVAEAGTRCAASERFLMDPSLWPGW